MAYKSERTKISSDLMLQASDQASHKLHKLQPESLEKRISKANQVLNDLGWSTSIRKP